MTDPGHQLAIVCAPCALSPDERSQARALRAELAAATQETVEVPNGYAFRYAESAQVFVEAAIWIALERRCCPFLNFDLLWQQGEQIGPWLTITGPEGTRDFLAAELPEQPKRD